MEVNLSCVVRNFASLGVLRVLYGGHLSRDFVAYVVLLDLARTPKK